MLSGRDADSFAKISTRARARHKKGLFPPAPASEALSAPPPECDATRSRAKFLAANTLFTYTR